MNSRGVSYLLYMSRMFSAAPAAVYRAFVEPGLLAAWFPRSGWSMPVQHVEIDPRPGGRLRYVLVSTHGLDRRSVRSGEFTDVQQDRLLAWTSESSDGGVTGLERPERTLQVQFLPEPHGTTRLELHEGPFSEAAEIKARACWDSAFSRLDWVLEGHVTAPGFSAVR
jgi:uncharacterized protein YndB with AHSA1/START domain